MPRAKTILQNEYPYSISARCINKEWFSLPIDFVWDVFSEELCMAANPSKIDFKLDLYSFKEYIVLCSIS